MRRRRHDRWRCASRGCAAITAAAAQQLLALSALMPMLLVLMLLPPLLPPLLSAQVLIKGHLTDDDWKASQRWADDAYLARAVSSASKVWAPWSWNWQLTPPMMPRHQLLPACHPGCRAVPTARHACARVGACGRRAEAPSWWSGAKGLATASGEATSGRCRSRTLWLRWREGTNRCT
jgi:hypothetical protein